jgi:protein-tyrosine phosphatase
MDKDIASLKQDGATAIVSLITEQEYTEYGVKGLKQAYKDAGLELISYPILDQGIPDSATLPNLLKAIDEELSKDGSVILHCVGGLGRSGTVAAAYLMDKFQLQAEQAIATVREHRSQRAVESKEQLAFLRNKSW